MGININRARYVLFTIGVVFGLIFFISLNSSRREEMEELGLVAFHNYFTANLYSVSTGYFQWDEFQDAVDDNNLLFIESNFEDILEEHPFIISIELTDGSISELYEVEANDGDIYCYYSIYDSSAIIKSNKIVKTKIDVDGMLTELYDNDTFYRINHEGEIHSLTLKIDEPLLKWGHYLSAVMIGLLLQFLGVYLHKQSIRNHYQLDGLKSILHLLSKKDFYTADHSEEVAELSIKIAKRLEFPRNFIAQLYAAGILHDIGKVGIKDSIINKQGKLTKLEWESIKEHPTLGYEIVSEFPGLETIAEIVKQHHEKLDGSGYPEGLKSGQISTLAQILAVADIYSAVTSDRPYRVAYSEVESFRLLREMPVNQEAVDALESIIMAELKER